MRWSHSNFVPFSFGMKSASRSQPSILTHSEHCSNSRHTPSRSFSGFKLLSDSSSEILVSKVTSGGFWATSGKENTLIYTYGGQNSMRNDIHVRKLIQGKLWFRISFDLQHPMTLQPLLSHCHGLARTMWTSWELNDLKETFNDLWWLQFEPRSTPNKHEFNKMRKV